LISENSGSLSMQLKKNNDGEEREEKRPVAVSTSNLDMMPKPELEKALRDLGLSAKGSKVELARRLNDYRQEQAERPTEKDDDSDAAKGKAKKAANLDNLSVPQLKAELKKLGLPVSGVKAELVERLKKGPAAAADAAPSPAKKKANAKQEEDDDDELVIEEEEVAPRKRAKSEGEAKAPPAPVVPKSPQAAVTAVKTVRAASKVAPPPPPPSSKKKKEEEDDDDELELFDDEKEPTPAKRQKSSVEAKPKKETPPKRAKKEEEKKDEEKKKETPPKKKTPSKVEVEGKTGHWYWAGDNKGRQNEWRAYKDEFNEKLEQAHAAGKFKVVLPDDRWVDLQGMVQGVKNDKTKRRAVLRAAHVLKGAELKRAEAQPDEEAPKASKKKSAPKEEEESPKKGKAASAKKSKREEEEEEEEEEEKAEKKKKSAPAKKNKREKEEEQEEEKEEEKPAPLKKGRTSVGGAKQVAAAAAAAPQKAVVSSTGITDEKLQKEVAKLATLGATMSDDDVSKCTHLVAAGKVLRTVKARILCGVPCVI
jgi:hypothetical protein